MENPIDISQQNYLQSLLSSLSPSSLQKSSKVQDQIKKHQIQIAQGQLKINESSGRNQLRLKKKSDKNINGRQSRSVTQENKKFVSEEQHLKMIKQITTEKKALQIRKQIRKKEEEKLIQKEQELNKMRKEQEKQEKEKLKKKKLQQKINSILMHKEKRQSNLKAQNSTISKLLEENKLYQKLEHKYLQKEAASLELKKKKLAEIRSLHQPITKEDILDHQKKIDYMKNKIPKRQPILRSSSVAQNVYKSIFYKKASVESKEKIQNLQKQKEEKLQIANRMKQKIKEYQRYVQNNFAPQVDEFISKQKIGHSTVDIRTPLDISEIKKKGEQYLKHNINHKKNKPSFEQSGTSDSLSKQPSNFSQRPKKSTSLYIKPQQSKSITSDQQLKTPLTYLPVLRQQHDVSDIDKLYLKKQKQSLIKKRYNDDSVYQQKRGRRRGNGQLNQVLNQQQLDHLYQKIIKVKEQIHDNN